MLEDLVLKRTAAVYSDIFKRAVTAQEVPVSQKIEAVVHGWADREVLADFRNLCMREARVTLDKESGSSGFIESETRRLVQELIRRMPHLSYQELLDLFIMAIKYQVMEAADEHPADFT